MAERSVGKDTTTGHWELAGITLRKPFSMPRGLSGDLVEKVRKSHRDKNSGKLPASGTVIIKELGQQHVKTGYPIIYTSADSVFR